MGGKVYIAAGHYPLAPGAGVDGFYEHDEANRWLDEMFKLDPDGRVLIRIPTGQLKAKTDFVNTRCSAENDVAVELHFNAFKDPVTGERKGSGCVTLYMPGSEAGAHLANACQDVLKIHFPPDRGIVEGWYRGNEEKGPYFFLAHTKCPAVILEPEFIHHRELIQSKRVEVAQALAVTLAGYVGAKL